MVFRDMQSVPFSSRFVVLLWFVITLLRVLPAEGHSTRLGWNDTVIGLMHLGSTPLPSRTYDPMSVIAVAASAPLFSFSQTGGLQWTTVDCTNSIKEKIVAVFRLSDAKSWTIVSQQSVWVAPVGSCDAHLLHAFDDASAINVHAAPLHENTLVIVRQLSTSAHLIMTSVDGGMTFAKTLELPVPQSITELKFSPRHNHLVGTVSQYVAGYGTVMHAWLLTSIDGISFAKHQLGDSYAYCHGWKQPSFCPITTAVQSIHDPNVVVATCLLLEPHCSSRLFVSTNVGANFTDTTPSVYTALPEIDAMTFFVSVDSTSGAMWTVAGAMNMTNVRISGNWPIVSHDDGKSWTRAGDVLLPCTPGDDACPITGVSYSILAVPGGLLIGGEQGTVVYISDPDPDPQS
jgi:hypothetical protein